MDLKEDRMASEASKIVEGPEREYPEEVKTTSGMSNVLRLLDGSNSYRKYWISWVMCDDDSIKPFIVENEKDGRSILGKVFGDPESFFKGGYLESKKGQFGKVNTHQSRDPELFKRMTEYWNPSYNGPGTCRPRKEYVFNVIHRNPDVDEKNMQFNWCDKNKHTKLLRMGARAFKALKVVRDNSGEFDAYDIVFSKQGTASDTFYTILKGDVGTPMNKIGPLSPEEVAYERYDLDFISRLASANYVLNNLRVTIERIANVMGVNWLAELEKQKMIEDEMYAQRKEGSQQAPQDFVPPRKDASFQMPPRPMEPISAPSSAATMECPFCHAKVAEGTLVCPSCRSTLLVDCDVCHKQILVNASKCPYCGQEYKIA